MGVDPALEVRAGGDTDGVGWVHTNIETHHHSHRGRLETFLLAPFRNNTGPIAGGRWATAATPGCGGLVLYLIRLVVTVLAEEEGLEVREGFPGAGGGRGGWGLLGWRGTVHARLSAIFSGICRTTHE